MCCCGKPVINGQTGYKWQPNDMPGTYPLNPPDLSEGDVLLFDEPGRCGGVDSHSYHYRVVKFHNALHLLVRHGAGDERLWLVALQRIEPALTAMDSTARYWVLNAIYQAYSAGKRTGQDEASNTWRTAAAEKRIKVRKQRGSDSVRVSIVSPLMVTSGPVRLK